MLKNQIQISPRRKPSGPLAVLARFGRAFHNSGSNYLLRGKEPEGRVNFCVVFWFSYVKSAAMKWILLVFVFTLSLSAFGQNSDSWPLTGKQFVQDCKAIIEGRRPTPDEMWDTAFCAGFFQGVLEGHGAWLKETKSKAMHLPCIPYDRPNKQFV